MLFSLPKASDSVPPWILLPSGQEVHPGQWVLGLLQALLPFGCLIISQWRCQTHLSLEMLFCQRRFSTNCSVWTATWAPPLTYRHTRFRHVYSTVYAYKYIIIYKHQNVNHWIITTLRYQPMKWFWLTNEGKYDKYLPRLTHNFVVINSAHVSMTPGGQRSD